MSFEDIPIDFWYAAWADLEEVVISGGSSKDLVLDSRPDTPRASHWLVRENSIVFLKAVTRLAYIRYGIIWDSPQTTAVARFLTAAGLPVVRNKKLREGVIEGDLNAVLGEERPPQSTEYETFSRLSRREQAQFRSELKKAYTTRCAISGCEVEVALEACHIISHASGGHSEPSNGLLLRRDLHRLFDLGLIAVEPERLLWRFHNDLLDHYEDLSNGRNGPDFENDDARLDNLAKHWAASQLND
ncbi:hypothetical protein FIU97_15105 [Roseivivax sp. THAF40]|uniref:HNH endonuclease n=1 Tax=unclassified Roseivivax TaxID=2639302 RepID=UPI001268E7BF|nr:MULTISPECIES: HNH endonuclease [unclassified Roseivivax]QFS84080.1 hypothetical protein FIV09_14695 [Roseivivax sp. THAF197b]QFT47907.1 hypothetical protein FIU97_15105 [Roseivivax sp. THAF40]